MDTLGIIREIESDPALRAQLRAVLLGDEVLALPAQIAQLVEGQRALQAAVSTLLARQDRLEAAQDRLEAAQDRLEAAMAALAESQQQLLARQDRLEAAMAALAESQQQLLARQDRLEAAMATLMENQSRMDATITQLLEHQERTDRRLDRLEADVAALNGSDLERRVREWPQRYLPEDLRGLRIMTPQDLDSLLDRLDRQAPLSAAERKRLTRTDVLASARVGTSRVTVVAEVSVRLHREDVTRAAESSRILNERGQRTRAFAIGSNVVDDAVRAFAEDSNVEVVVAR
jgi:exonuclease VII small subunit